ncbi:LOW QUALITY PROTEIN: hypothetical protein U9M48_020649, partial [Paspalum notatum var. saurae]
DLVARQEPTNAHHSADDACKHQLKLVNSDAVALQVQGHATLGIYCQLKTRVKRSESEPPPCTRRWPAALIHQAARTRTKKSNSKTKTHSSQGKSGGPPSPLGPPGPAHWLSAPPPSGSDTAGESDTPEDSSTDSSCDGDASPHARTSSIIFTTYPILGRCSGAAAAQLSASCSIATISSSMPLSFISSRSNTSDVHSSRTTDCTHRGSSTTTPPFGSSLPGHRPVSSSSSTTPNAYTSPRCDAQGRGGGGASGARYPADRPPAAAEPSCARPQSASLATPNLSRRMLVLLTLPCASFGVPLPRRPEEWWMPRAAPDAMRRRADHSSGVRPGPRLPCSSEKRLPPGMYSYTSSFSSRA